ncbi:hypothetical protein ACJRO7_005219 [Eucalyptus globulus]
MELKPHKIKFKIRLDKGTSLPPPEFGKGKTVEVSSDEKGYEGSWFSAIVIDYIGNDKYLVEYLTLKTDDETEPLREKHIHGISGPTILIFQPAVSSSTTKLMLGTMTDGGSV